MLTFDAEVQTLDGVKAILRGTFMEMEIERFADIFMRAGEAADISPYFLASRAIQEMGAKGESPLAHGTLPGYEGYYNFYNIGSYPNPEVKDGQRINGALFAMYGNEPEEKEITPDEEVVMLPWDTAEKSILGGAVFIAERYVAAGQNTLYFQKFDVVPENGLYTRQYAQNIQMAWAEGCVTSPLIRRYVWRRALLFPLSRFTGTCPHTVALPAR
jgi:beta-N-acetylglucosaminidase